MSHFNNIEGRGSRERPGEAGVHVGDCQKRFGKDGLTYLALGPFINHVNMAVWRGVAKCPYYYISLIY